LGGHSPSGPGAQRVQEHRGVRAIPGRKLPITTLNRAILAVTPLNTSLAAYFLKKYHAF